MNRVISVILTLFCFLLGCGKTPIIQNDIKIPSDVATVKSELSLAELPNTIVNNYTLCEINGDKVVAVWSSLPDWTKTSVKVFIGTWAVLKILAGVLNVLEKLNVIKTSKIRELELKNKNLNDLRDM